MTTTRYTVTGMSCGHCEGAIREEVAKLAGIDEIQVSAKDGSLVITSAGEIADADVLAAVDEAGYAATRA